MLGTKIHTEIHPILLLKFMSYKLLLIFIEFPTSETLAKMLTYSITSRVAHILLQ